MGLRLSPPELLQPSVASSMPSLVRQGRSTALPMLPLEPLYPWMGLRLSPPELLQPSVASSTPSLGQQGPSMASPILPLELLYPLTLRPLSSAEQPGLSGGFPGPPHQHPPSI